MAKTFTDRTIVIPKNEDSDETASLRIVTNTEKETVTIEKTSNWGGDAKAVEFPVQFLRDVIDGLDNVKKFIASEVTRGHPAERPKA